MGLTVKFKTEGVQDFHDGPVVKTPLNAGGAGSIPGQRTRIDLNFKYLLAE